MLLETLISIKLWCFYLVQHITSPNEHFEYGYDPHSNAPLRLFTIKSLFRLKLEFSKPPNAPCHPMKRDVINDVKLYLTIYRNPRIYSHKFFMLSNLTSGYKSNDIGIPFFRVCTVLKST